MSNEKPLPILSGLLSVLQDFLSVHSKDYRNLSKGELSGLQRIEHSAKETHQQLSDWLDFVGKTYLWATLGKREGNRPFEKPGDFSLALQTLGLCILELTEIQATAGKPAKLLGKNKGGAQ